MKGKKTYLVGALAVASAALLWWFGAIETGQAATLIFVGLGLISLRHGLTTERIKLLLELVAPYRPSGEKPEAQQPSTTEAPFDTSTFARCGERPSNHSAQGKPKTQS